MSNQIAFRGLNSTLGATCGTNTDSCDHDGVNTLLPSTTKVVGTTGHQFLTVHVWDSVGCETDNIARVYKTGECVFSEGKYFFSKTDMNVSKPEDGSAYWDGGYTLCQLLNPGLGGGTLYTEDAQTVAGETPAASLVLGTSLAGLSLNTNKTVSYGNTGGTMDSTGKFTAGRTGVYTITLETSVAEKDANGTLQIAQLTSNVSVPKVHHHVYAVGVAGDNGAMQKTKTRVVKLNAGDSVWIEVQDTAPGFKVNYIQQTINMTPQLG